mmetsp:Transcript_6240/g.12337  ORF Transcript_6240/g.12337 Transcript_6240/m.12337 type:complete len:151 (-) Transcript_6240:269-721(-)
MGCARLVQEEQSPRSRSTALQSKSEVVTDSLTTIMWFKEPFHFYLMQTPRFVDPHQKIDSIFLISRRLCLSGNAGTSSSFIELHINQLHRPSRTVNHVKPPLMDKLPDPSSIWDQTNHLRACTRLVGVQTEGYDIICKNETLCSQHAPRC